MMVLRFGLFLWKCKKSVESIESIESIKSIKVNGINSIKSCAHRAGSLGITFYSVVYILRERIQNVLFF